MMRRIALLSFLWVSCQAFAPMGARRTAVSTPPAIFRPHAPPLPMTESTMQTKNSGPPPPPTPEQEPDPLQYQYDQFVHMNRQAKINLGIMLLVAFAVLYKFTTINAHMMRGWTAEEIAYRIPVDNWLSYSAILDEAPVQTKAVTSATVYTIGDLIAQRTEGKAMGELDRLRTVRSMAAGLLAHGPMSHYWYEWSESVFENVFHWTQWWSFFPKVIVDQALWGPFWNNSYIILLGLMKRESLETMWGDVKRTTIPLVVSGLKLWPLAHCVTYGLVPVENRLLWVDLVEIVWVTILATQAAGGVAAVEEDGSVSLSTAAKPLEIDATEDDVDKNDTTSS